MTVHELMKKLEQVCPDYEVISHANNHTALHGGQCDLRVLVVDTYAGKRVMIGNMDSERYPDKANGERNER